mmetsp:Transcript_76761/g.150483  ORF Transcript_76761/g.150483 Transcript_76761/m.150483 type:complete len:203 (+) Transcript_76761:68-676(+)
MIKRSLSLCLAVVAYAPRSSGLLVSGGAFTRSVPQAVATSYRTSGVRLFAAKESDPEPPPCVSCGDEVTYWDGGGLFACTACGHEWPVAAPGEGGDAEYTEAVTKDSNGAVLLKGDTVVLTKELGKGLKKGMKVARIRLGNFGDDHDVEAVIPGLGTYALKSQFLKFASRPGNARGGSEPDRPAESESEKALRKEEARHRKS